MKMRDSSSSRYQQYVCRGSSYCTTAATTTVTTNIGGIVPGTVQMAANSNKQVCAAGTIDCESCASSISKRDYRRDRLSHGIKDGGTRATVGTWEPERRAGQDKALKRSWANLGEGPL